MFIFSPKIVLNINHIFFNRHKCVILIFKFKRKTKIFIFIYIFNFSDVGPHLVYKNGQLWPQDVPLPQSKSGQYDSNDPCFSPENAPQFPAYFKDAKGNKN